MDLQKRAEELVNYAKRSYNRGLVGGTGGNFSVRMSGGTMAITASGLSMADTERSNLITMDIETYEWKPVDNYIPSKEYLFHADILRVRPDVNAVLHLHSPYTTAYSIAKREIPMVTDAAFKQPPIPCVPYAQSGTKELQRNILDVIQENPTCKIVMLEKHGIISMGEAPRSVYDMADLVEELARIAFLQEMLTVKQ